MQRKWKFISEIYLKLKAPWCIRSKTLLNVSRGRHLQTVGEGAHNNDLGTSTLSRAPTCIALPKQEIKILPTLLTMLLV